MASLKAKNKENICLISWMLWQAIWQRSGAVVPWWFWFCGVRCYCEEFAANSERMKQDIGKWPCWLYIIYVCIVGSKVFVKNNLEVRISIILGPKMGFGHFVFLTETLVPCEVTYLLLSSEHYPVVIILTNKIIFTYFSVLAFQKVVNFTTCSATAFS